MEIIKQLFEPAQWIINWVSSGQNEVYSFLTI